MTKTVFIPPTLEVATTRLGDLDRLLTAHSWERAAIVAAFVQPSQRGISVSNDGTRISAQAFADLGIVGLRSHSTVRLYAMRWLDAHDGEHPEPGEAVELPEAEWPPDDLVRAMGEVSDAMGDLASDLPDLDLTPPSPRPRPEPAEPGVGTVSSLIAARRRLESAMEAHLATGAGDPDAIVGILAGIMETCDRYRTRLSSVHAR